MKLFSLRKICRICPQHRGSGPPAPAHGSTDFIKCQSLVTRSMARIKPIELVSWLLISDRSSPIRQLAPAGGGVGSCSQRLIMAERDGSPEFEFSQATVVGFR
jgi:hypothetical protein